MPAHRLIPHVRRAEDLSDGKSVVPTYMGSGRIRPTHAEIDLAALVANAARVKAKVGEAEVLAVVKADAYGHGAIPAARALVDHAPIGGLAVSLAEEGLELRRAGIAGPILVMGGVYGTAHRDITAAGLTPVVSELADVAAFARGGKPVDVHVKIDTGMSRLGVRPEHLAELLDGIAAFPNVHVTGYMTHLASAESDPELTRLQLARFQTPPGVPRHAANTAAILHHPESHFDAVRPGLALFGSWGDGSAELEPVMRLCTAVAQLRDLAPGDTVSYGAHFRAARPSRIATLPVGYADGYPRRLSSQLQPPGDPTTVLLRGRRCPVVGSVCMDMLMIDVTDVPEVHIGDEVVLLGRQGDEEVTAGELARRAGLIEYEITCGVSKRVPRLYRGAE